MLTPNLADATSTISVNSAGDVTVIGDGGAQQVVLSLDAANQLTVKVVDGPTTTSRFVGSSYRDLTIDLKGGNDRVNLYGHSQPHRWREVEIDLGGGTNSVDFQLVDVSSDLTITDGSGKATVILEDVDVDGDSVIDLGGGFGDWYQARGTTEGTTTVTTDGWIEADVIDYRFDGRLDVIGGGSADRILLKGSDFRGPLTKLDLGGGNDLVLIRPGVEFRRPVEIWGRGGKDNVNLFLANVHDRITVNGNAGADIFGTTGTWYGGSSTFNGGTGTDRITGEANNFEQPPSIISIEHLG